MYQQFQQSEEELNLTRRSHRSQANDYFNFYKTFATVIFSMWWSVTTVLDF